MSRFEVNEKVIIFAKKHELYGKIARILQVQEQRHNVYKLHVSSVDSSVWFSEAFLRPVRYLGATKPPAKKDFVKVVDVKGNYASPHLIGCQGLIDYVDNLHLSISGSGENSYYLQLGDYELIPNKKTAWVVRNQRIYKEKLTRLVHVKGNGCSWRTEDNFIIQDNIVFDDIVDALDCAGTYIPEEVNRMIIKQ